MELAIVNKSDGIYKQMIEVQKANHPLLSEANFIMFVDYSEPSGAVAKFGKAQMASPQVKCLTGADFVITIYSLAWEKLTTEGRDALLDHELSHCSPVFEPEKDEFGKPAKDGWGRTIYSSKVKRDEESGATKWKTVEHDVTEFVEVLRRRGLWVDSLKAMRDAMEQLDLFEHEPVGAGAARIVAMAK